MTFPVSSEGTLPQDRDLHRYLEHNSVAQLSAAHQGSCRWHLAPSGSALWCPRLLKWRPAPWSFLPFDQSRELTEYQSGSSSSQPKYNVQMPHLQEEAIQVTLQRKKWMTKGLGFSRPQMSISDLHVVLQQEIQFIRLCWVRFHTVLINNECGITISAGQFSLPPFSPVRQSHNLFKPPCNNLISGNMCNVCIF